MSAAIALQFEKPGRAHGVTQVTLGDETHVITSEPLVCGVCETPHYIFVNRKGTSCCWECAEAFKRAEVAMRAGQGDVTLRGSR